MKQDVNRNHRNKLLVEAAIRKFGPLSRVQLREATHLNQSLVSQLTRQLLAEGRLLEAGRGDNLMGRKRVLLRLNEQHAFVAAVGFDDENVLAGVMDLRPAVKAKVQEPTYLDGGAEGLLQQLISCARRAIQQSGIEASALEAFGVAGSGLVDSGQGLLVMSSTIDFLREVGLQQIFAKEFGLPTLVENITRAKAMAERTLGSGRMADDMIYIEYGRTGIGAGIISKGRLLTGLGGAAGEFGHTHMVEDGPACKCGSFGCLEAIAGAAALEARIRRAIAEGSGPAALAMVQGDASKLTGWTVLAAAREGDKTCSAIVEQAVNYLGLGVANLVNLFNPSVVVLDQRLSWGGNGVLDQIVKIVKRQALAHCTRQLDIRFGQLGSEAVILGVASLLLEARYQVPAAGLAPAAREPASLAAPRELVSPAAAAASSRTAEA